MKISKSAKYVKRLRKLKKMSQVELSKKTGIKQSSISKIEKGAELSALNFIKIMKAMGLRLYLVKE